MGLKTSSRQDAFPYHADRKSTRLNSSHRCISYAVFCLKKKHKPRWRSAAVRVLQLFSRPATPGELRLKWGPGPDLEWRFDWGVSSVSKQFFFFNERGPPEIYPLSPPNALPI